MATDLGVGDVEVAYLDVTPGDGTTDGTLTVTAPDDTETEPAVTAGAPADGTVRLTASAVTYDQAGKWVLHWDVTGTGAGSEDVEVYVVASPTAGGPTWLPGRSRVAAHIPNRTLARNPATYVASGDAYALTFDSTTRPSGVAVSRLIADAAAWIASAVPTVAESLYDMAGTCAAIWAAAAVERGWPDDDSSLARARDLQALAEKMRADLVRANTAETGTDPADPGSGLLPVYSFPDAVAWGDSYL